MTVWNKEWIRPRERLEPAQRALGRVLGAMERRDAGYQALRGGSRALLDPAEFYHGDAPQGPHPAADGAQGVAGPQHTAARSFDQKFVACPWDEVLDLLANELSRVRTEYGAAAVFGGSYGWSSAGRFHHAQSQVHRFLNTAFGGYVRSVNSYSAGASAVILPHILGGYEAVSRHNVTWDQVAEHTDTVLAFGGMALKNSDVASGGISRHIERDAMQRAAQRGAVFYGVSPLRDDMPEAAGARWLPIKVGTDVALMLALAHTLLHRKSLGPRLCRALLHRLRNLRTLSARPR